MIRVGFDWDDVLAPWYDPAHVACERAGITNGITPTTWRCHDEYGVEVGVWMDTLRDASFRGEIYAEPPYEEALWAIRSLWWNHPTDVEIVIATARSHFSIRDPEWLKQTVIDAIETYAIPCHELLFVKDKREAECDFFIDDSLKNYDALDDAGVEVYLQNRPWNAVSSDDDDWGVRDYRRRVSSVTKFINRIEEKL